MHKSKLRPTANNLPVRARERSIVLLSQALWFLEASI